jgi:hypothetical protein
MQAIKLNESYKNQFYDFVLEELEKKQMQDDPVWKIVKWIDHDRDIYAVVDDDNNFLMVNASNESPITRMPWRYGDTQLGRSGRSYFQQIEVTKLLIRTMLRDYEEQGYWAHWYLADYRKEKAFNKMQVSNNHVKEKLGRFVIHYLEAFEDYNIHDVAWIKKGATTNIPFYDRLIKQPVPYDMVIRFATLKNQNLRDNKQRYTYG